MKCILVCSKTNVEDIQKVYKVTSSSSTLTCASRLGIINPKLWRPVTIEDLKPYLLEE